MRSAAAATAAAATAAGTGGGGPDLGAADDLLDFLAGP